MHAERLAQSTQRMDTTPKDIQSDFDDDLPSSMTRPPEQFEGLRRTAEDEESDFSDRLRVGEAAEHGSLFLEEKETELERQQETADVLRTMRELDTGEGIYWRISRIGHDDPSLNGHMGTWPDARVTLDTIKDAFGGGTYRCKGFRSNGGYAGHKTIRIAGDAIRKAVKVEAAGQSFDVVSFVAQMDARQAQDRRERLREESERELREEKRRKERIDMLIALGPSLATVAVALLGNKGPDIGSLLTALKPPDPLQMIAALKALAPEPDRVADPLDKAFKIMAMLKENGALGTGDSGVGWMDIVKELTHAVGPSVGNLIEGAVENAKVAAAQRQATNGQIEGQVTEVQPAALLGPQATGSEDTAAPQGAPVLGLLAHLPWLKAQVTKWVPAAAKARNPELYASLFLEELPDGLDPEAVGELLSRSDWFQQLARLDARIGQFQPWFTELHGYLMASISALARDRDAAAKPKPAPSGRDAPAQQVDRPMKLPSITGE